MNPPNAPVIFFDGVCGLCNSFVDWVMRRDKKKIFLFTPLQGKTAKETFGQSLMPDGEWTINYVDEKGRYERSGAVLRIIIRLDGGWKLMGIFLIVPPFIRDGVYKFIAKRRYRWFGKRDVCRLPSPQEKGRFLP